MSAFFTHMSLARWIILFSFLGSIALAWLGWKSHRELREMRGALEADVPKLVGEIQELSEVHTKLTRDKDGDQFLRQANPELYIRGIGDKPNLLLGNLRLLPQKDHPSKGIVDQKYRITPEEKIREYARGKIALFLYSLEAESRRVKVTDVKLDLADRKIKPHEVPRDAWTFEAEVTSRQKEGE